MRKQKILTDAPIFWIWVYSLGKTFVGSEKLAGLKAPVNLIVCQKSKVRDWTEHFTANYNMEVYDLTKKKDFENFEIRTAKDDGSLLVGIINYDLIFRRSSLKDLAGFTLLLDESSEIQNEKTKRAKFILKMHPENVILLSGSPTGGKYEKLWSQCRLLGWNISKDLFYSHYVVSRWVEMNGFMREEITGYKNVDRLKKKLVEHGAVFMKSEEVFDMPGQNFIWIKSRTTKEYRKFMKDKMITIDNREFIGDTVLSQRIYARMMCSYLNSERLEAFRDLVQSTDDRLIVFYNYTAELTSMLGLIEEFERPVSIVNGKTKDLTAYEEDDSSVTFIQYQAGAMGLNLQKANKVVYFSLTDRSELFEQSKKRIHRIGQFRTCFYYLMICPKTVEEDIFHTLEMRRDYTDELFKRYQERNYS